MNRTGETWISILSKNFSITLYYNVRRKRGKRASTHWWIVREQHNVKERKKNMSVYTSRSVTCIEGSWDVRRVYIHFYFVTSRVWRNRTEKVVARANIDVRGNNETKGKAYNWRFNECKTFLTHCGTYRAWRQSEIDANALEIPKKLAINRDLSKR